MPPVIEDRLVDLVLDAVTQVTARPSDAVRAPARRLLRRRLEERFGGTELFLRRAPRTLRIPLEVQESPPAPLPPRRPVPAAEKTFIEIELLDEDNQPVPRARYVLTLPNGRREEGRLDEKGFVRVDGIEPGMARVRFPDLDPRETEELPVRVPRPAEAAPAAADVLTFIEIELVDDAGNAVPGERFVVTPPNAAPREGRLGPDGRARIEGIEPGTCQVSFPDIDAREWRAPTSVEESP